MFNFNIKKQHKNPPPPIQTTEINHKINFKNIPIFIISFNRLSYLKQLVEYLENKNYTNINIIDNKSTYGPLLDYLKNSKHKVYYMDKNYGHRVFWECNLFNEIINNEYYIVTDNDVLPTENCPDNFAEMFYDILQTNPCITKVGFSLKIDDIDDSYELKKSVLKLEKPFYSIKKRYEDIFIYEAQIDTTFALYKPKIDMDKFYYAIRTGSPYQARHLPWYPNKNKTEEEIYYIKTHKKGISNYSAGLTNKELTKKVNFKKSFYKFKTQNYTIFNIAGFQIKIRRKGKLKDILKSYFLD